MKVRSKKLAGIGIVTYNRLKLLKQVLQSIEDTVNPKTTDVFVADDGSDDGTIEYLKKHKYCYITGGNLGIAGNTNRLFPYLIGYPYMFILNDDILPRKRGWVEFYTEAIRKTRIQHFNYIFRWPKGVVEEKLINGFAVSYNRCIDGILIAQSRRVAEVCGGFDKRFRGYGYAHIEYTERAAMLSPRGVTPYVHLVGSEWYMMPIEAKSVAKKSTESGNRKLYEACKLEFNPKRLWRGYE